MFISRSSGGPHDPVRHRAHAQTRTRTYSFTSTHRVGSESLRHARARTHTHTHTDRSCASPLYLEAARRVPLCASIRQYPSVGRSSATLLGGLRMWGAGAFRCSSAGSTSQLPHCSSSPPSGKLIRSRVPGPSAGTHLIQSLRAHLLFN